MTRYTGSETIPAGRETAFCPDLKNLHEKTIIDKLNLKDEYLVYYSVEDEFDLFPAGAEYFARGGDSHPCIRLDGSLPPGEYNVRYKATIYYEYGKYVNSSSHSQIAELLEYFRINIMPPVALDHDLIAFTTSFYAVDGRTLAGGLDITDSGNTGITELVRRAKGSVTDFSWSPDGRMIAYAADDGIFTVNIDDGAIRELLHTGGMTFSPTWSADGKFIAFLDQEPFTGVVKHYGALMVVNTDDLSSTMLTAAGEKAVSPKWSPDGKWIAYTIIQDESMSDSYFTYGGIFLISPDGSTNISLKNAEQFSSSPIWSPDGSKITFIKEQDVCVVNSDGSHFKNLTNSPDIRDYLPTWDPTSTSIAYVSTSKTREDSINVITIGGKKKMELGAYPRDKNVISLAWGPDGKLVYELVLDLFVMNSDGSGVTLLGEGSAPAWQ